LVLTAIKRHPVVIYFALVFAISWGGDFLLIGQGGIPGNNDQVASLFYTALIVLLAGPFVAGPFLTALGYGMNGLNDFRARLFNWRISTRWYTIALLTMPAITFVSLLSLSLYSSTYLPTILTSTDTASLLMFSIFMGLFGGMFEELGWSGFAVPKLRLRYGVLTTGLIVGFLWGAWHFLITFWSTGDPAGAVSLPLLIPPLFFYAAILPAYRVLMVWVYDHTNSIFVMMLMHASLIVSTLPAPNGAILPSMAGVPLLTYYLALSGALWLVVAAVYFSQWKKNAILKKIEKK
jgi:membrane protease YdiL (CAAX protease family)